ncbi:Putative acetyltransferase SACOL2570 [Cedecea davisae]|uniref:Bacterial transferase hexapeptide repeat protein n=1 Tax=Cedecea davisae DSM 4568 TaxID=566551 RepID=S3IQD1_9ENTR|nr:acyltransferase [Cedecea davisae]EPF16013.1 bacterial transferase hexapeptide repeat protein [Cedecea davisae DSM 4568]SUX38679.1 Putative acetyltransferase SACOL2570 [Cedecea davisae]
MLNKIISLFYKIKYKWLIDKRVIIHPTAFIHHGATFIVRDNFQATIQVNENVYVGRNANIHTNSYIIIGRDSVISDYVYISTLAHGINPSAGPILTQPDSDKGAVVLGDNVFLGFGTKILPNIQLGDWTIVGAGSVVTKSYPEGYVMIAGNPAKIIKRYDPDMNEWIKI